MDFSNVSIDCLAHSINGYLCETIKDIVLVIPGYSSSKDSQMHFVNAICEKSGHGALVIDMSGNDISPIDINTVSFADNFIEVIRSYDWLKSNYPNKKINVFGISYGGYFAALLSLYREVNKMILRVPAIYYEKDFYTTWGQIDRKRLSYERINNPELFSNHSLFKNAKEFKGQSFVITHELDEDCTTPTTDMFIKAFNAQHWDAKGFIHSFNDSDINQEQFDEYISVISDWLN